MTTAPLLVRSFLMDQLTKWVSTTKEDNDHNKSVLLLQAPNSSGKSHALREFARRQNTTTTTTTTTTTSTRVVVYEFTGGKLAPEQTCEHVLLEFLSETVKLLGEEEGGGAQVLDRLSLEQEEDAYTLFHEYLVCLVQSCRQQSGVDVCFVIDGPERCGNAGKLWGLCRAWAELAPCRLIISTTSGREEVPNSDVLHQVCFKPVAEDELVMALVEDALDGGGGDRVLHVAERCRGNVLMALLAVQDLPQDDNEKEEEEGRLMRLLLDGGDTTPDNFLDTWYDAATWPELLVCRRQSSSSSSPLGTSQSAKDWFLREHGQSAAYKQAHLALGKRDRGPDAVFHLVRGGDLAAARAVALDFAWLYEHVTTTHLSTLLLDLQAYCDAEDADGDEQDWAVGVLLGALKDGQRALQLDPRQLAFQLLGRIPPGTGSAELDALLVACREFRSKDFAWFAPQSASFQRRTLMSHSHREFPTAGTAAFYCLDDLVLVLHPEAARAKLLDALTGRTLATLVLPLPSSSPRRASSCHDADEDATSSYCWLGCVGDGAVVAVVSVQRRAWAWFLADPRCTFAYSSEPTFTLGGEVESIDCSSNQVVIGSSRESSALLWQLPAWPVQPENFPTVSKTFRLKKTKGEACSCCSHVALVPTNQLVCTAFTSSSASAAAAEVYVWSVQTEQRVASVAVPHTNFLCMHPSGSQFATGGADGVLRVWRMDKLMQQQQNTSQVAEEEEEEEDEVAAAVVNCDWFVPHPQALAAACFLPSSSSNNNNGDMVATSQQNGAVQLYARNRKLPLLLPDEDDHQPGSDAPPPPRHLQGMKTAPSTGLVLAVSGQHKVVLVAVDDEQAEAAAAASAPSTPPRTPQQSPAGAPSPVEATPPPSARSSSPPRSARRINLNPVASSTTTTRLTRAPLASGSVLCAVVNEHYLVLVHQEEMCVLELASAQIVKRLSISAGGSASRALPRNMLLSKDGRRLRAVFEGGGVEMTWSVPEFARLDAPVASSKKRKSATTKRRWSLLGSCATAPAAPEVWHANLILPLHSHVQGQSFVESDQFAMATFASKQLHLWRVPRDVASSSSAVLIVLELETGLVHVLHARQPATPAAATPPPPPPGGDS